MVNNRPFCYIEKPPRTPLTRRRKEIQAERKRFVRAAKKYISRRYDIPKSWVKVRLYKGEDIHFFIKPKIMVSSLSFTINIEESETEHNDT